MTNQKYQTNPPKTINNTYIYLQLKIETNWIQKKTHTHTQYIMIIIWDSSRLTIYWNIVKRSPIT